MALVGTPLELEAEGLQQGRETAKGELGVLVGQVSRLLSFASVRAQAECLLSKLRQAGGGSGSCQQEEGVCCEGRGEMGQGEGGSDGGEETG